MDLALAIENLVPAAQYGGSTTANDQAAFNAISWTDGRSKPTWAQIQASWEAVQIKLQKKTVFDAAVKTGYDCRNVHASLNFFLRIDETGRQTALEIRSQLERKKGALLLTDLSACPYRLEDVAGGWHDFSSVGQCLSVIEKGGDYYATLVRNLNS